MNIYVNTLDPNLPCRLYGMKPEYQPVDELYVCQNKRGELEQQEDNRFIGTGMLEDLVAFAKATAPGNSIDSVRFKWEIFNATKLEIV